MQTYNEAVFCGRQQLIFTAVQEVGADDSKREHRAIVERR